MPNYSKIASPAQPNRGKSSIFQSTIADTDLPINDKRLNVCGFISKLPIRFIVWALEYRQTGFEVLSAVTYMYQCNRLVREVTCRSLFAHCHYANNKPYELGK